MFSKSTLILPRQECRKTAQGIIPKALSELVKDKPGNRLYKVHPPSARERLPLRVVPPCPFCFPFCVLISVFRQQQVWVFICFVSLPRVICSTLFPKRAFGRDVDSAICQIYVSSRYESRSLGFSVFALTTSSARAASAGTARTILRAPLALWQTGGSLEVVRDANSEQFRLSELFHFVTGQLPLPYLVTGQLPQRCAQNSLTSAKMPSEIPATEDEFERALDRANM